MTADTDRPDDALMQVVVAAKDPIGNLGGAWMTTPAEEAATEAAGLKDWQLYFLGRHGVLGDVDPDVVTASAYVFPAEYLRREWTAGRLTVTPEAALAQYMALCHDWAKEHLGDFAAAQRLADLAQRIIGAVDVAGLPLFAGWRAVDVPPDPALRCGQLLNVLREHRGACHGVALVALGMSPLMAILSNLGGKANAEEYGWEPPFPSVTAEDRTLRSRVETLTDDLVAPAYGSLSIGERQELLDLLALAHQHCFPE